MKGILNFSQPLCTKAFQEIWVRVAEKSLKQLLQHGQGAEFGKLRDVQAVVMDDDF